MKITIKQYKDTYIWEYGHDDVSLEKVMQSFCEMLRALGWHEDSIIALFNEENGEIKNNPFLWSPGL